MKRHVCCGDVSQMVYGLSHHGSPGVLTGSWWRWWMVYSTRHQMAAVCRTCQQCLHTSRVHVSGESGSGRSRSSRSVPEYRAPIPTLPYTRAAILPEPQSSSSTGPSVSFYLSISVCSCCVSLILCFGCFYGIFILVVIATFAIDGICRLYPFS